MNVLISLHRGYGLGDSVQMSAVLRHVRKYRPNWIIDYQAEEGKHQVARGIAHNHFAYGEQPLDKLYDAEVLICLYDTWANWGYKPNTRVSSALHECFGLEWDAEYGRYQVNIRPEVSQQVEHYLRGGKWVGIHYQGDSSPDRKNLSHHQADAICMKILELGYTPLIFDFRNKSPLDHWVKLRDGKWRGYDAEYTVALIAQCKAFVGIDSGPGKCASATNTPTLITWTGHHPAPFHDPAPNTTHLVPEGYHGLFPVCDDSDVIQFFEKNYLVKKYDIDPIPEVKAWLEEVLK